jgi:hypothetical protein
MEKFGLKDLAPNWESIGKPLKRPLKEAILLSLNIIPDWESHRKNLLPKSDLQINFDYVPRLQLAIEWALEANFLVNLKPTKEITENDLVYLSEFANWAVTKQDWKMPSEFRAMASAKSEVLIPTKASKKRGRPIKVTEDIAAKLIQMKKDNPELSNQSLGDEFKLARTTVNSVLKKKT